MAGSLFQAHESAGDSAYVTRVNQDVSWRLDANPMVTGVEENEPTGATFSDGDSSVNGLLGNKAVKTRNGFLFFTQKPRTGEGPTTRASSAAPEAGALPNLNCIVPAKLAVDSLETGIIFIEHDPAWKLLVTLDFSRIACT